MTWAPRSWRQLRDVWVRQVLRVVESVGGVARVDLSRSGSVYLRWGGLVVRVSGHAPKLGFSGLSIHSRATAAEVLRQLTGTQS